MEDVRSLLAIITFPLLLWSSVASAPPAHSPFASHAPHSVADFLRNHSTHYPPFLPHSGSSSGATPRAPSGLHGFRRFHANDTLIGRSVPCAHQEKLCFKYNMLFNPVHKKCFPVDSSNFADTEDFLHGSGHLRSMKQQYEDPCSGYRMSYDGRCYVKEIVRLILCGCPSKDPTPHILGGVECRCRQPTPVQVEQPDEEGRCLVSDLRFPNEDRSKFFENPFDDIQGFVMKEDKAEVFNPPEYLTCSSEQSKCFSEGKVWLPEGKDCFVLLERGPCAEDHVVALDVHAAREGRVEATCADQRGGCPQGHSRMAFDGQCHNKEDLEIILPGEILSNQFGHFLPTSKSDRSLFFQPMTKTGDGQAPDKCALHVHVSTISIASIQPASYPPCGDSDTQHCPRYEVQNAAPTPEFD